MFKHNYLSGALKRVESGKPNYRDRYYMELFRIKKDFSQWPDTSTLSSSLFYYILDNYKKTVSNREDFFTLYKDCGNYPNPVWLLVCLRLLDIYSISFPDELSKKEFLNILEQKTGNYWFFPVTDVEERVVINATDKKFWETSLGIFSK